MMTRRQVLQGAAAWGVMAPSLVGCSSGASEQDAARALRRPGTVNTGDQAMLVRELVRYATLAPSSHNTQCWSFHLQDRSITIAPDLSRRCPVVDPDDHHVFVSLGCATENLAQAALANSLFADARFNPSGAGAVTVSLKRRVRWPPHYSRRLANGSAPVATTTASHSRPTNFACSNRQVPAMAYAWCC